MATKFGGKNPNQSIMHRWGLRSYRGQLGSTRGQLLRNDLWPPNLVGQIPDKAKCIAGVKGHEGISWGQVLKNALWPPNLVGRTPDQSVMHCWGQRSCYSIHISCMGIHWIDAV